MPIISNDGKSLFKELSMGYMTGRDDWTHDFDKKKLVQKIKYFIEYYNKFIKNQNKDNRNIYKIKLTDNLINNIKRKKIIKFSNNNIRISTYRPFCNKFQYFDEIITHRKRKFDRIFQNFKENKIIGFTNPKPSREFSVLATEKMMCYDCINNAQCIPLYINGKTNITKYGQELFCLYYKNNIISIEDIFYYVYAILNDPKYEKIYRFNLQRTFPRIPLVENFELFRKIGQELFLIHTEFDNQKEYGLESSTKKSKHNNVKLQLKQTKENDYKIIIDENTTLKGIPPTATQYMLGSKCALEWILEFYRETKNQISDKSSNDPKVREKFNTYNFADHKEHVISLLKKVTTVSLKTMELREKLEKMEWGPQPDLGFKTEDKEKTMSEKPKAKKIKKKKTTDKIQKLDSEM